MRARLSESHVRSSAALSAVSVALMLGAVGVSVAAQGTQRILLVHGLGSEGNGWASTESRLLAEFGSQQISVARPNLSGLATMETQAEELTGYFGADSAIAIAHSAGGVVSRTLDRRPDRQLKGIITIGTPHQGAPLSNNKAAASAQILQWIYETGFPPTYYINHLFDNNPVLLWLEAGTFIIAAADKLDEVMPVFTSDAADDIKVGSTFLAGPAGLNSAGNLQREAASMPGRRLAIVNHTATFGQFCQLVFNTGWANCVDLMEAFELAYFAMFVFYSYYNNPGDPYENAKRENAIKWLIGSTAFYNMNSQWCSLIGAPGTCDADDLVPAWSQQWPGVPPADDRYEDPVQHSHQRESELIQTKVVELLRVHFGLQSPPPPPPPPPPGVTVEISGQSTIASGVQCQWWASVSGASGSVTYAWFVDGVPIPNSNVAELTYGSPNPPFQLSVSVTAANGGDSATHEVAYDPEGWCQ